MRNKKSFLGSVITVISATVFSLLCMVGISVWSSSIPNESFRAEVASQEGHILSTPDIDSFTLCGSLMPFTAETPERDALNRALMVPFPWSAKTDPCPELKSWISGNDWPKEFVNGTYARYWWGAGSTIRILTNWLGIAGALTLITTFLLIAIMIFAGSLARKFGNTAPILVITPILLFTTFIHRYPAPHISLPFAVALVSAGSSILFKTRKNALLAVFIGGMWISFLDLLTYPVVYAFIACSGLILGDIKAKNSWLVQSYKSITYIAVWFLGYGITIFGKQLLLWIFGDPGASSQILAETLWRMDGPIDADHPTTPAFAIKMVLIELSNEKLIGLIWLWSLILAITLIAMTIVSITRKTSFRVTPIAICLILPIAWFVIVKTHTIIHPWLAYYSLLAGLGLASAITFVAAKEQLRELTHNKNISELSNLPAAK